VKLNKGSCNPRSVYHLQCVASDSCFVVQQYQIDQQEIGASNTTVRKSVPGPLHGTDIEMYLFSIDIKINIFNLNIYRRQHTFIQQRGMNTHV
jgi:hypothetical protein